jgi:hypothetical protein
LAALLRLTVLQSSVHLQLPDRELDAFPKLSLAWSRFLFPFLSPTPKVERSFHARIIPACKSSSNPPKAMAASVLGKRQRQSITAEGTKRTLELHKSKLFNLRFADPAQSLHSRKRRALDSTPRIYNDSDGPSKARTSQDVDSPMDLDDWPHTEPGTTRPVATSNVLSKRTVQNNRAIVNSNDGTGIVPLSKAVAGVYFAPLLWS